MADVGAGGVLDPPASQADDCVITIRRPQPLRMKHGATAVVIKRPGPLTFRRCEHSFELEFVTEGGLLVTVGGEPVWVVA